MKNNKEIAKDIIGQSIRNNRASTYDPYELAERILTTAYENGLNPEYLPTRELIHSLCELQIADDNSSAWDKELGTIDLSSEDTLVLLEDLLANNYNNPDRKTAADILARAKTENAYKIIIYKPGSFAIQRATGLIDFGDNKRYYIGAKYFAGTNSVGFYEMDASAWTVSLRLVEPADDYKVRAEIAVDYYYRNKSWCRRVEFDLGEVRNKDRELACMLNS